MKTLWLSRPRLSALGRRLAESLRYFLIDADALDPGAAARLQIRLSPS